MINLKRLFFKRKKKSDIKAPILEALSAYKKNPMTGFHIPGHNRGAAILPKFVDLVGKDVFALDTTDEFDNLGTLHPATGAIKRALKLAAEAFGAQRTFFLTGGSTIGNLALALGVTKPNSQILIGRNCHRSVLCGMVITGAEPNWLIPKKLDDWAIFGAVSASDVEKKLKNNPNIALVWITNPTYEGVISDIKAISKVCKKYNVPLIVDEAHGSLWNFSDRLPQTALELGADAVVNSLHKTGGSMVQSSMLHIAHNSLLDPDEVERALMMIHSTSPSMLALASLDSARAYLNSSKGLELIDNAIDNALFFRDKAKNIKNVSVLSKKDQLNFDPTKIFIKVKGLSGIELEKILEEEFRVEVESASDEGILILSNIGGRKSEFEYLLDCFKKIASRNYTKTTENVVKYTPLVDPEIIMTPRIAYFCEKEVVKKEEALGRICSEIIALCPPGISVLLPGELIREEHLPYLTNFEKIEVVKN